jgi:hypothetical protein
MKCPVCGLENPDHSLKCDCGFEFRGRTGGQSRAASMMANLRSFPISWRTIVIVSLPPGANVLLWATLGGALPFRMTAALQRWSIVCLLLGLLAPVSALAVLFSLASGCRRFHAGRFRLTSHVLMLLWCLAGCYGGILVWRFLLARI